MRETRSHAIYAHVRIALTHSGLDQMDFADDVARIYHERTPLHVRGIDFRQHQRGVDPYEVRRANEQLLFRMLKPNGPVRMAVEVEEAVVLALPERFRDECLRELSGRYGLMPAPLPATNGIDALTCVGEFSRDFGDCLVALAKTAADGRLEPMDAAHAPEVISQLHDLVGRASSLIAAHQSLLAPRGSMVAEFPKREGVEV